MSQVSKIVAVVFSLVTTGIASLVPLGDMALSAEVRIMSSANMISVFSDLSAIIESETGHKLLIEFAEGGTARDRVISEDSFDLTINAKNLIEQMHDKGRISGVPVDIARATISVAVRKGEPKPDVTTLGAIKRWLSGPALISYSELGISGLALKRGIAKLAVIEETQ
jgi:molybdate transport system substrate-binding protein